MDDTSYRRIRFLVNLAYFSSILGITYVLFKYGFGMAMPFILALMVAAIAQPVIGLLSSKFKIRRSIASIISVLFVFFTLVWFFGIVISVLAGQVRSLTDYWPTMYSQISAQVALFITRLTDLFTLLPPYVADYVETAIVGITDALLSSVGSLSVVFLSFITSAASKLPTIFVGALVTIAASIFISADFDIVRRFIAFQIPDNIYSMTLDAKQFFKLTVLRLLRAYMIICFITFIELNIGFALLGIKNGVLISACLALFDILPIFGCGGILVPWAIIAFLFSNYRLAFGIAILYLVVTSMRQIIEPKVIGSTIGLHPVVSLLSIYCGLRFFGVIGMFTMPVLVIVLKHLQDAGYMKIWRTERS